MTDEDYSKFLIRDYKYWGVYIANNQSYLGRCVVWCKRIDALDLADATLDEQTELFKILFDLREANKIVFGADWFNYAFLGNDTRHLHGHFIPRYKSSKLFEGVEFKDEFYGHNYKTNKSFVIPDELLEKIKNVLVKQLNN